MDIDASQIMNSPARQDNPSIHGARHFQPLLGGVFVDSVFQPFYPNIPTKKQAGAVDPLILFN